jgi:phosphoribosylglycinamide formyltransferase-1
MKRIVILISGRGSNMEGHRAGLRRTGLAGQVVAVVANRPDAEGLAFAQAHGIATAVVDHKATPRARPSTPRWRGHRRFAPDLVVLAGFMRILGTASCSATKGACSTSTPRCCRPSRAAHAPPRAGAGCQLAGATVHFVTPELDHGPIVMQAWCRCARATTNTRWPPACWPPNT